MHLIANYSVPALAHFVSWKSLAKTKWQQFEFVLVRCLMCSRELHACALSAVLEVRFCSHWSDFRVINFSKRRHGRRLDLEFFSFLSPAWQSLGPVQDCCRHF